MKLIEAGGTESFKEWQSMNFMITVKNKLSAASQILRDDIQIFKDYAILYTKYYMKHSYKTIFLRHFDEFAIFYFSLYLATFPRSIYGGQSL